MTEVSESSRMDSSYYVLSNVEVGSHVHIFDMVPSCDVHDPPQASHFNKKTDPENPSLEPNMEWIGGTVCEIFAFKLHGDLETGVRGHSRSSKVGLFDRAHTTSYSSSIRAMPLSSTLSQI